MASNYFDEHDCEPTSGTGPEDHTLLDWARLLVNDIRQFSLQYDGLGLEDGLRRAPPAAKEFVKNLPEREVITPGKKCPICLLEYERGMKVKELPCEHHFHCDCIIPWLKQTNSCPLCRLEMPTDDPDYEEYRKEKARKVQREFQIESLHNSMFT